MLSVIPVAEQRFALEHSAGLAELAATERFATGSPHVVDAVLEGVGAFAAGEDAFGRVKRTVVRFYLDQIVPEALDSRAAAPASADVLDALEPEELAAT